MGHRFSKSIKRECVWQNDRKGARGGGRTAGGGVAEGGGGAGGDKPSECLDSKDAGRSAFERVWIARYTSAMESRAMYSVPTDGRPGVDWSPWDKTILHVLPWNSRSSSLSPFHGFLSPDLIYRSLQVVLDLSLAKGCDIVVCWGDILRHVSNLITITNIRSERQLTNNHSGLTVVTVRM